MLIREIRGLKGRGQGFSRAVTFQNELRLYPLIEFFKNNRYLNHIGIAGIDPR